MGFYTKFERLCIEKGVTPAKVRRDLGISQSTMASWKSRGLEPKYPTAKKIADYFGINVDNLFTETWGITAGGEIKAGGAIKSRYGIKADGPIEADGSIEVGPNVYEESAYVNIDAGQKRHQEIDIPLDLTSEEAQQYLDLFAQIAAEASEKISASMNQLRQSMTKLNDAGKQKVIKQADDYAQDLAKIPEYRAETTPESTPLAPGNTDTPTPPTPTEAPPEGKEDE